MHFIGNLNLIVKSESRSFQNRVNSIRDQYSEILRKQWMDIFTKIFEDDNYTPILIENQSQYDDVVEQYPYHDAELEKVGPLKILY